MCIFISQKFKMSICKMYVCMNIMLCTYACHMYTHTHIYIHTYIYIYGLYNPYIERDILQFCENVFLCLLSSNIPQFSSATQSCPTLCNPMNCRTPGLPVHHQLPEFTQTHVHQVCDAIQPSHSLSSPSPPAPSPSQHQGLFQ